MRNFMSILIFASIATACPLCKDDLTEIIVVLDRSGSMIDIRQDMIGGFAQLIEEQKKCVGSANFTLAQFDTEYELIHKGINIQDVNCIELIPRGRTALMDAIGKTIRTTAKRLVKTPKRKVVFVIITDGLENASKKYDKPTILKKIKHMEVKHGWKFLYIGANHEAFEEGISIGIPLDHIMYFDNTNVSYSIDCITTSITNYRNTGAFVFDPNGEK